MEIEYAYNAAELLMSDQSNKGSTIVSTKQAKKA